MSMALDIAIGSAGIRWHVGCPPPLVGGINLVDIYYIVADGDELEKIRTEITGIPMSTKRVVTWYGDDARFIVANLNY